MWRGWTNIVPRELSGQGKIVDAEAIILRFQQTWLSIKAVVVCTAI